MPSYSLPSTSSSRIHLRVLTGTCFLSHRMSKNLFLCRFEFQSESLARRLDHSKHSVESSTKLLEKQKHRAASIQKAFAPTKDFSKDCERLVSTVNDITDIESKILVENRKTKDHARQLEELENEATYLFSVARTYPSTHLI
jgi:septal ring factor EnvC (AmiA/AmiB activator)